MPDLQKGEAIDKMTELAPNLIHSVGDITYLFGSETDIRNRLGLEYISPLSPPSILDKDIIY
jgi:hypothetical protein